MLSGLLLACLTSQTVPNLSTDSKIKCYESQRDSSWKYLEYLFIVQPANELKQASNNTQAFMAIAGAVIMARSTISNCVFSKKGDTPPFDLSANIAGLVISGVAYQSYCSYLESSIRMSTMIKFLENWSTHRSHVPEEFAAAFDELATSLSANQNSVTNEQLNEMFEIIQHLIEHTFEKRYTKAKDLDILGTFKTFTDIGKNLKG